MVQVFNLIKSIKYKGISTLKYINTINSLFYTACFTPTIKVLFLRTLNLKITFATVEALESINLKAFFFFTSSH